MFKVYCPKVYCSDLLFFTPFERFIVPHCYCSVSYCSYFFDHQIGLTKGHLLLPDILLSQKFPQYMYISSGSSWNESKLFPPEL